MLEELTIELTNHCILECIFCSSCSGPDKNTELALSVVKEILDQGVLLGTPKLYISGGESLLYKELYIVLRYAKKLGHDISLYTSGLINSIVENNPFLSFSYWTMYKGLVDRIIFNFQSCDGSVHDYLCGNGSHARTLYSMMSAIETGFDTEVHIIPTIRNMESLVSTVIYLDNIGVKKISFLRLVSQGNAFSNKHKLARVGKIRWSMLRKKIIDLGLDIDLRFGIPFQADSKHKCTAGKSKLVVSFDGRILPCEAFKHNDDLVLGHISNTTLEQALEKMTQLDFNGC